MKKLITSFIFLLSLSISAQTDADFGVTQESTVANTSFSTENSNTFQAIAINESFEEAAEKNNIAHRTLENLKDVEDGYYVVSGVFSKDKNLKKLLKNYVKKVSRPVISKIPIKAFFTIIYSTSHLA